MIDVLYFADREVKQKLFARVTQARKLLMVTTVPPHRAPAAKAHKERSGRSSGTSATRSTRCWWSTKAGRKECGGIR